MDDEKLLNVLPNSISMKLVIIFCRFRNYGFI